MGVGLLDGVTIATYRCVRPQLPEALRSLVHQLLRMGNEQDTTTTTLCIQNSGCGFARAGCVVKERNGLAVVPHFLQCFQGRLLVLL